MKNQFATVIDKRAKALDYFYVSGGKRGTQVRVSPKELAQLIGAAFDDIAV